MAKDELLHSELTESIVGAYYEVYNRLSYGFPEGLRRRCRSSLGTADTMFAWR
jgi:hypothetical protein